MYLLDFYHPFVVCYHFVFNQRLLKHCLEKPFEEISQNFPFVLRNNLTFVCYKVARKLSFLIFKFELFFQ